MFALLKRKNPHEQAARAAYAVCLEQARRPLFYSDYGVPDSFDGRFDLLVLHLAMAMTGSDRDFNQALFDAAFADMDQTLREMGIGDMGVPKHMRRMMKGFNGRVQAYHRAFADGRAALEEALRRNLYGTLASVDAEHVEKMAAYVEKAAQSLHGGEDGKKI